MGIDGVLPEHSVGGALAFQRLPQIQTFLLVEPADGIDERLIGLLGHAPLLQSFRHRAAPLRHLFQQRQLEGAEQYVQFFFPQDTHRLNPREIGQ